MRGFLQIILFVVAGLSVGTASAEAMKQYKIMDNHGFGQPIAAYTVNVPQSWAVEGQIVWNKPCSGKDHYELVFTARSADGRTGYRIMPGHQILWIDSVVSGFDPQLAQMILAQDEASRNDLRTQFRNSNCHVGKVSGTQQLLQELVLTDRPAGTIVDSSMPDQALMTSFKSTFPTSEPGMKIFYDAVIVELRYPLAGQPVEESLFLSWYMFQLEPLDPTMGTLHQQTVVDSLRFAWIAPERRESDRADLQAIVGSFKINPEWDAKIQEFRRKIASQNQVSAAERERRRLEDEARRDVQHQQFLDYIQQ
ncbi:MAG: hypothetical protein V3V25_03725 [Paracoccaceae bacterium]